LLTSLGAETSWHTQRVACCFYSSAIQESVAETMCFPVARPSVVRLLTPVLRAVVTAT